MKPLTQTQTEALIRLLLLAKRQDRLLSLAEDKDFQKRVDALPWDSGVDRQLFIDTATAEVREAVSEVERVAFLEFQCPVFNTRDARHFAVRQVTALLEADGIAPKESDFLRDLREQLG